MQHGAAGEHRQRLMSGICGQVSSERKRVQAEGAEMTAVGVIHQQRHTVSAAYRRKSRDIAEVARVIRTGDIHRTDAGIRGERPLHRVSVRRQHTVLILRGPKPYRFESQQHRRVDRAAVRGARHQHPAASACTEQQHRLYAQCAPSGAEQRFPCAEGCRRKLFRLLNHVAAVVQAAGARQFGQIQRRIGKWSQQQHMPLMPWCMKRGGMSRRVCMQRREKRRFPLRHNCAG